MKRPRKKSLILCCMCRPVHTLNCVCGDCQAAPAEDFMAPVVKQASKPGAGKTVTRGKGADCIESLPYRERWFQRSKGGKATKWTAIVMTGVGSSPTRLLPNLWLQGGRRDLGQGNWKPTEAHYSHLGQADPRQAPVVGLGAAEVFCDGASRFSTLVWAFAKAGKAFCDGTSGFSIGKHLCSFAC